MITHTPSHHRRSGQSGVTLIELTVTLAVFAALIALAVPIGNVLLGNTEVQGQKTRLTTIQRNVQDLFSGRSNYANLDTSAAIDASVFPKDMVSGSSVVHAWGADVTVEAANDTNGNADRAFEVTWEQVPEDACTDMATGSSAVEVSINGSAVSDSDGSVDPTQAGSQCAGGEADIAYLYE